MRAMFITLRPIAASAAEATFTTPAQQAALRLAEHGVDVHVVELRAIQPRQRRALRLAGPATQSSAISDDSALVTHALRWPVLSRGHRQATEAFWPGAGFAFPFICSTLVDMLHAHGSDILLAEDMLFTGYVAWRLREITGIPYVIACGQNDMAALENPKTAQHALREAIGRDAQCIIGRRVSSAQPRSQDWQIRFRFLENGELSGPQLKELLEQAVQQSSSGFDW